MTEENIGEEFLKLLLELSEKETNSKEAAKAYVEGFLLAFLGHLAEKPANEKDFQVRVASLKKWLGKDN